MIKDRNPNTQMVCVGGVLQDFFRERDIYECGSLTLLFYVPE